VPTPRFPLALPAALALLLCASIAEAGGITAITTTGNDSSDASGNYSAGGNTFNFNSGGTPDNLTLTGLTHLGAGYSTAGTATQVIFRRNDNAFVTGNKQLLWYQHVGLSGSTYSVNPARSQSMEESMLGAIINRGTDNVFVNINTTNNNNIERIDYVYDYGLTPASAAHLGIGFAILERGGNDAFGIAAITAIDGSGNATSYGTLFTVATSVWGGNLTAMDTVVVSGASPATPNYVATANVTGQSLEGVLVTLSDLGVAVGQTIYGYSLFADDVIATDNLVDWTTFATNSNSGLDLVAGGLAFNPNSVNVAGVFATPEPGTWALFGLGGFLLAVGSRRRRKRKLASPCA
jgi:PEP-CTERM motif-containing protein